MVMEWQPIETAPIPEFDSKRWYAVRLRCLIASGSMICIGHYSYTEKGKGRWKNAMGYVTIPTHWMPLPPPPAEGK